MTRPDDDFSNNGLLSSDMDFESTEEHHYSTGTESGSLETLVPTNNSLYNVPSLPALACVTDTLQTSEMPDMSEDFSNLSVNSVNEPMSMYSNDVPERSIYCAGMESSRVLVDLARNLLFFLPDEDGDTSLHVSIVQEDEIKSVDIINRAPEFMYLSIANNLGQTPTHLAALTNSAKVVRTLVCAGADIMSQDKDGNTPLHLACIYGHLEVVKALLRPVLYSETTGNKYAIPFTAIPQNMSVRNFDGQTCLHLAVLRRHYDIIRLILETGADVNSGDSKSGRTALHLAAEQGMMNIVSLLLTYPNTVVDSLNYAGYTPAQLAHSRAHHKVSEFLFRNGASYNQFYCDASEESDVDISEE